MKRHVSQLFKAAGLVSACLILPSCQTLDVVENAENETATSVEQLSALSDLDRPPSPDVESQTLGSTQNRPPLVSTPSQLGRVPVISERNRDTAVITNTTPPPFGADRVDAFVAPLPLPQFIDVAFGEILNTPYVTGPAVAARTDVVQLRSSGEMDASDFKSLIETALEDYGIRVVAENGAYRILEDASLRSRVPRFINSRARASTRGDLRPVIQFVELNAVSANSMAAFLNQAFGRDNDRVNFTPNPLNNYITLTGLPEDVDAVLAIILELDELNYAGSQVRRYTPRYWTAAELSEELANALRIEGWQVSTNIREVRTVALLPVEYSNDIFIFTKTAQARERVDRWLTELDRPIEGGDNTQLYIYQVKNVAADELANIANAALNAQSEGLGMAAQPVSSEPVGSDSNSSQTRSLARSRGAFTVDPIGNRLVFSATVAQYDQYISLLEQLDTLAPEVLIEVQIAEVTLTDDLSSGVEFFIDDIGDGNVQATVSTQAFDLGASGLDVRVLSGNVNAAINAFSQNRRVKVLSTPVLTARSGSTAEIQVGTDVPIITAQRAANNQAGAGELDILQNVEYRSTGVLLAIEPIVFSNNRVDLTISQEVSATIDTASSEISSPTISNRSISTQLSLVDGGTAMLGGLIQENTTRDNDGIPLLKDVPVVGKAFSTDAVSVDRTELIVLITAYVLRGQDDMNRFVDRFRQRIDRLMDEDEKTVTLEPR